jgi:transposase
MDSAIQPVAETSGKRRYRTVEERRRIVEETLADGVSVAVVARRHGVNANQLFHWRKLYQAGLMEPSAQKRQADPSRLLPVTIVNETEPGEEPATAGASAVVAPSNGAIHIEFPGRALVSVEGRVEAALVRAVLESLRG